MLSYIHNLECYRKPLRPHARVAHRRHGRPYRVLYVFDPQRNAVLLIGGDKTGNEQWYETFVPLADRLYERRLHELEESDDHGKSKKLQRTPKSATGGISRTRRGPRQTHPA